MLRRDTRLRKEFLYRKSLEERERRMHDKKQRLKQALDENKPIPQDLREDAAALADALALDAGLGAPRSAADDEYSLAGVSNP